MPVPCHPQTRPGPVDLALRVPGDALSEPRLYRRRVCLDVIARLVAHPHQPVPQRRASVSCLANGRRSNAGEKSASSLSVCATAHSHNYLRTEHARNLPHAPAQSNQSRIARLLRSRPLCDQPRDPERRLQQSSIRKRTQQFLRADHCLQKKQPRENHHQTNLSLYRAKIITDVTIIVVARIDVLKQII